MKSSAPHLSSFFFEERIFKFLSKLKRCGGGGDNKMINSKILLSGATIAAAGALIIGATFAYFSDVGTSSGNTFGAGTLDLQLDDSDETSFVDNVTATFNVTDMAPGTKAAQEISL